MKAAISSDTVMRDARSSQRGTRNGTHYAAFLRGLTVGHDSPQYYLIAGVEQEYRAHGYVAISRLASLGTVGHKFGGLAEAEAWKEVHCGLLQDLICFSRPAGETEDG